MIIGNSNTSLVRALCNYQIASVGVLGPEYWYYELLLSFRALQLIEYPGDRIYANKYVAIMFNWFFLPIITKFIYINISSHVWHTMYSLWLKLFLIIVINQKKSVSWLLVGGTLEQCNSVESIPRGHLAWTSPFPVPLRIYNVGTVFFLIS